MKGHSAKAGRIRKVQPEHPLAWLGELLDGDPGYENRAWFGGRSLMLDGKHRLVLMCQGEPWQGVLVCTTHEQHAALRAEIPALMQHPVLGKWLYLPETAESFERDAQTLVRLTRSRDPRIGISPTPRKKRVRKIRFGDDI